MTSNQEKHQLIKTDAEMVNSVKLVDKGIKAAVLSKYVECSQGYIWKHLNVDN